LRLPLLLAALLLWTGGELGASPPIVVMLEAAPKTLDPFYATDATGVRISHQLLFDTLVRLDDRLEVAPGIARRWERLTPTRYRFALETEARFHDGTPLDAGDVLFTLETLMSPELASPYGSVLREKIAAVRRVGAHTVEIELKAPYAAFLSDLILPVRSRKAGRGQPLVGSGPFRFERRSVNEIAVARNDAYHGPPARAERVIFKVVRDANTRLLKLRKGGIDLAVNVLPLDKLAQFRRSPLRERFTVLEAPGLSYQYLGFNLKDPLLSHRRVRRAIAHAINVEALIVHRQKGHSTRATGLFPKESPYGLNGVAPIAHDPALAARLLDEAGFSLRNGRRFALTYKTSTERSAVIQARVIQSDLRKVGIALEVRSYEWGTFYEDISKGNFQLFSLRWIGVSDPDFYYELFHSSRVPPLGRNRGHYSNPRVDRLLEAGRLEGDPTRRRGIYRELARILHEELPYVSLWHNNNVAIVSKRLSGFRLHPTGGFQHLPGTHKAAR
jgi:peptide/nickel transport system substrate-binding protein